MIVMMRLFFYERTASSMWTNHSKIETLVNSTWLNCLARSWHWMSCPFLAVEDIRSDRCCRWRGNVIMSECVLNSVVRLCLTVSEPLINTRWALQLPPTPIQEGLVGAARVRADKWLPITPSSTPLPSVQSASTHWMMIARKPSPYHVVIGGTYVPYCKLYISFVQFIIVIINY